MNITELDDDSLRKMMSYLSFKDHFNLVLVDQRFENVVYTACKYIYVKLTVRDLTDQLEPEETNLDFAFFRLITGRADEEFLKKYQIFNYIEKLNLEYKINEPIDLSFMGRLKELNLNLTRANSKCEFAAGKNYPNIRTLFIREFSNRYQTTFPELKELGCEFIQNDIVPTETINLLCINAIYPDELVKFTNLKMISLDVNNSLFNISHLPLLLTKVPTLNKLHINFFLRKNTLSIYTRAIQRLVNIKNQNKLSLELCIHLHSSTKDHPTVNTYNYRDSEIRFFNEHATQFISNLVSFQINNIELTFNAIPDSVTKFEMVGVQTLYEKDLIPLINSKNVSTDYLILYLKNLKTIKLTIGTDVNFFSKLAKLTSKLKSIDINCPVEQQLLNSIPVYYKDISSFQLYDQLGKYDIEFLKNMRHLRTLSLQIKEFENINDLQMIIKNCIFLNYLTINLVHYEEIKENLINIYKERSIQYPFTTIILTIKFEPTKLPAQTSYDKITERFCVHILSDLNKS